MGSILSSGVTLQSGTSLVSTDGRFTLTMQTGGDLVLGCTGQSAGTWLWDSGTAPNVGAYCTMARNGDLIIYDINGNPLKHSRTAGNWNGYLGIDVCGNILMYTQNGVQVWEDGMMYSFTPGSAPSAFLIEAVRGTISKIQLDLAQLQEVIGHLDGSLNVKLAPVEVQPQEGAPKNGTQKAHTPHTHTHP